MRYKGGIISAIPPTVTTSSAKGMWTLSEQAQYQQQGMWPVYVAPPTTIGQAYGGGYYAGKIAVDGGGTATHYLIVAPRATGENSNVKWGTYGVTTGLTSLIDGPTNSASEAALGVAYQAATFCEGLTIGGYTDWYLPAKNELEVLYYFLKSSTTSNDTASGSNANAVSPEPISTNYTSGSPAQTSASAFRSGQANAFADFGYLSSSELNGSLAWAQNLGGSGNQYYESKSSSVYCRAVRRIPI
jgi:hypothetical protein